MNELMYVIYADAMVDPLEIAVYEIRQLFPVILLIAAVIVVTVITIKKNKKK